VGQSAYVYIILKTWAFFMLKMIKYCTSLSIGTMRLKNVTLHFVTLLFGSLIYQETQVEYPVYVFINRDHRITKCGKVHTF